MRDPIFLTQIFTQDPELVFVLMPFSEELTVIYDKVIASVLTEAGLNPVRADNLYGAEPIMEEIWQHINRARFLIADLTGENPNVCYEIGIAHTLGKAVILITQDLAEVPFDLRHLRIINYHPNADGLFDLREKLKIHVKKLLDDQV